VHRLSNRADDRSPLEGSCGPYSIHDWLEKTKQHDSCGSALRQKATLEVLAEKKMGHTGGQSGIRLESRPRKPRSVLHLPFSQDTFEEICRAFQVHKSIVRTVARSDVPAFSCEHVEMGRPALGTYAGPEFTTITFQLTDLP